MSSLRPRPIATLDKVLDWCVENWHAMLVLLPAGTFVIFSLVLFFGLTVIGALAVAKTLAAVEVVGAVVILVLNLKYRRRIREYMDAADAIEAVLDGDDAFSDWKEFIAAPVGDQELERIRLHCLALPREFPPAAPGAYCGGRGIAVLERYIRQLRAGLATRALLSLTGSMGVRRRWKPRADLLEPAAMRRLDAMPPAKPEPAPAGEPAATTATKKPVTGKPVTKKPVTKKAAAKKPVTREPVTKKPVTNEPVTNEPVTKEPVTKEPVTKEPVTNKKRPRRVA